MSRLKGQKTPGAGRSRCRGAADSGSPSHRISAPHFHAPGIRLHSQRTLTQQTTPFSWPGIPEAPSQLGPQPRLPPHGLHFPAYSPRTLSPSVLRMWTPFVRRPRHPEPSSPLKTPPAGNDRYFRLHEKHGLGLGLCFPACPGPRTPSPTPSGKHQKSDPTPTLSPTQSVVYTPDSISQHAQGLAPPPACSRRRTTSPSIPGDSRLSPGKGPCSCCKFPKIFWLSRWMRRVTTWGTGGQRSNETRGATVLVLLFPPPTGVPGSPLLGPHAEEPCPNSRVSASSPLPGALSALNLSY